MPWVNRNTPPDRLTPDTDGILARFVAMCDEIGSSLPDDLLVAGIDDPWDCTVFRPERALRPAEAAHLVGLWEAMNEAVGRQLFDGHASRSAGIAHYVRALMRPPRHIGVYARCGIDELLSVREAVAWRQLVAVAS